MWVLINGLCKPSLEMPGQNATGRKWAKKWTILKRNISVTANFDGIWFVFFEHTINCLSFGYVRLPQPKYYFSSFFLKTFCIFFFLFRLSTFKPIIALNSRFEQLKISGRTNVGLKLGCQVGGIPLNHVLQNFKLFNR